MGGTIALVGIADVLVSGGNGRRILWTTTAGLVLHSPHSGFDNLKIGRRRWQSWRLGETAGGALMWLARGRRRRRRR